MGCVLISFILMFTLKPLSDNNDQFLTCVGIDSAAVTDATTTTTTTSSSTDTTITPDMTNAATACFGISAVLRMTFTLLIFHIFILLLILPRNQCASVVHDSGWTLKFFIVIAVFIAMFWVPIGFF